MNAKNEEVEKIKQEFYRKEVKNIFINSLKNNIKII